MSFVSGFKAGLGLGSSSPVEATKSIGGYVSPLGPNPVGAGILNTLAGSGGFARGSEQLISAYLHSPHIRKVVGVIATQLAAIDTHLVKVKGKRRGRSGNGHAPNEEIITDHPFLDFVYDRPMLLDYVSARKVSFVYLLLKGESFRVIMPGPDGQPQWLVVPPQWVKEVPGIGGGHYAIQIGAKKISFPEEFVLWVKDASVMDPYARGAGVGDSLRDELDTDEYASNLLRTTTANKGLIEGILSVDGELGAAAKASLKRKFEEGFRGGANSGRLAVLDREAKYTQLTHAFSELRLLELRAAEKTIIEETFCVPPELFGKVTGSNRATIHEAMNIFAETTLKPLSTLECAAMTQQWLPHFDKRGEFYVWFDDPSPRDTETLLKLMQMSPEAFTANEIRSAGGLGPADWGDVRYVQGSKLEVPAAGQKKSLVY